MLKRLQSLKAKKGFTLVELIVVIAIIAVLAAILVPTMMGYVIQSRVTSADSTATSLKDTIGNVMVDMDAKGYTIPVNATVTLGGTSSAPTCTINPADANTAKLEAAIKDKIKDDYSFNKPFTALVYIENRKSIGCAYCSDSSVGLTAYDATVLKGGYYSWTGADGVDAQGNVIGTSPKVIRS